MTKSSILIIGAQHGNERFGPRVYRYIQKYRPDLLANVDYLCGNPKAYRQGARFLQTDLNRSYDADPPLTYEQKRAQKILRHIASQDYDYILDIHTTFTEVGRFLLVTELNSAVERVVNSSSIERVVIMPQAIAGCSLIGRVPITVSVEYNRELAKTSQALNEVVKMLDGLIKPHSVPPQMRRVYRDVAVIPLSSPADQPLRNFVETAEGLYPFLVGNNTYAKYKGFAAGTVEGIRM